MPNGDKPKRASGHVEPDPDECLREELLRIDKRKYEEPRQRVYERSFVISERLSLELQRIELNREGGGTIWKTRGVSPRNPPRPRKNFRPSRQKRRPASVRRHP
jgi:hypothetical protein